MGRCGLGPEEGRDRAAPLRLLGEAKGRGAGCRAGWEWWGWGGSRSRQPLEPKRSRLHSRFFGSHLSTPSTAPHRFLSFETPGEMPTFPSPSCPGGVSPRIPEAGEKRSQDGGARREGAPLEGGSPGVFRFCRVSGFRGGRPVTRAAEGLPRPPHRGGGHEGVIENAKCAVGCLWVGRSDPRLTPPLGGPRLSQPPELGAHKATETGSVRGRGRSAAGGQLWSLLERGLLRSPERHTAQMQPLSRWAGSGSPHRTPPALCSQPPRDGAELQSPGQGGGGRSTSAGSSSPSPPTSAPFSPASQARSRNHPPSKHQGPPCLQAHLPLKLLLSCGTDTPDPSLGIQVTGASLGTDFTPLHSSSFTDGSYFPTYLLI